MTLDEMKDLIQQLMADIDAATAQQPEQGLSDTMCICLCLYFCDFNTISIKSRSHLWEYIRIRAELCAASQSELVY
jgi:hypothetical protein